jgi:alkylhydroperoxidase family enzyme
MTPAAHRPGGRARRWHDRPMSRIPLADDQALDGFLRELHDGAADDDWATRHVARAFDAHPALLEQYLAFYYPWHAGTGDAEDAARLPARTKELVRLRIATLNGCQTCMAARLAPDAIPEEQAVGTWDADFAVNDDYTAAERAAMAFAERMAVDHHGIADADVAALREHFDDAQVLELLMMAGQYIGFGRMLAILHLETVECPLPAR